MKNSLIFQIKQRPAFKGPSTLCPEPACPEDVWKTNHRPDLSGYRGKLEALPGVRLSPAKEDSAFRSCF